MSSFKKNYITKEGAEALRQEYQHLFHVERPKLVTTVAWAASNGDRSENADYIYGKRRLREIDRRLGHLNDKLSRAEVVDISTLKSDKIIFGAVVEIEDEEGNAFKYQIVGEDEIDAEKGKMSWKSPVGKALLGKKIDEEVEVKTPNGIKIYTVLKFYFKNL
ncbi:MAG: transcription elongation factor GreB [Bdellovibrionota bacterium]